MDDHGLELTQPVSKVNNYELSCVGLEEEKRVQAVEA